MTRGYPYQGLYNPFGFQRRNRIVDAEPLNPQPPSAKRLDTGDAGQDGYTVYSRADRQTGERPDIGPNTQDFHGPRLEDE